MIVKNLLVFLFICGLEQKFTYGWRQIEPNMNRVEEIMISNDANCQHGDCQVPPPKVTDFPRWVSSPVKDLHDGLFRSVFNQLMEKGIYFNEDDGRSKSPFNFRVPEEHLKNFDLTLGDEPASDEAMSKIVNDILEFSPRSGHPFNVHRRTTGSMDPYGIAADWIVTAMSSPLVTYLVAPVFTLAELEMLKEFRRLIGYPMGNILGEYGEGIGTIFPNGFAVQMALQRKFPDPNNKTDPTRGYKENGIFGIGRPQPVIFISENGDYSFEKQAAAQGIGTNGVIRVKVDSHGRMDIGALRQAIEHSKSKNQAPFMIVGTAGTPILGAIDNLGEIAKVAQENDIWYHVDGTLGGALVFSQSKSKLIKGIELSDSVGWSAHGLLGAPIETGVFVTRHENILRPAMGLSTVASVLNTTMLGSDRWNIGDSTFQTCRRSFTFDIWYMWKAKGTDGFAKHIEYIYENSAFATEQIGQRQNFKLILPTFDLPQISFYYIPSHLRGADSKSPEFIRETSNATESIKNQLLLDGNIQLSTSDQNKDSPNEPTYFTIKLTNSALNRADIVSLLDQIENCGSQLFDKNLRNCARIGQMPKSEANYPTFVSSPIRSMHETFHKDVIELIFDKGLYFQDKRADPPLIFKNPEVLAEIINFNLTKEGSSDEVLLDILEKVIRYSPHCAHPYWIYQLSAGIDPYTLMGDFIQAAVSSPSVTYEDNPLFALMERETSNAILKVLNWPNGDVLFPAGGTMANFFASHFSRFNRNSRIKSNGFAANDKQMRIYFSQECHFSLPKSSYFLGFGRENGVVIGTMPDGRMNLTELRLTIESDMAKGLEPIMVAATAGTTVLGSIDPLNEMADICKEYGLWFHVDGAFGGSLFLSKNPKIKDRLRGLERADSFSFNPAKIFGGTILLNLLAIKNAQVSRNANALGHPIDFKSTGLYNPEFDTGDKYLQRNRRSTAVKMWFMMKAKGFNGLSAHLEAVTSNVEYCVREMKLRRGFYPAMYDFDTTNVLFLYVPNRLRNWDKFSPKFNEEIEKATFELQAALVAEGAVVIVAQRHRSHAPLHLKFVLMGSALTQADIKYLLDEIDRIGAKL